MRKFSMIRVLFVASLLVGGASALSTGCNADSRTVEGDEDGNGMKMPGTPNPGDPNPPGKPGSVLSGKVVAPEGTIPISGALVYVTTTKPEPIPDGVYCDKCVHLPDGTAFTTTKSDGTFTLPAGLGNGFLVVQKGAFRRVRPIVLTSGPQVVPRDMTTLPPITDKANGDDIPKIAVLLGAWDPIELVLAKMGLKAKISKDALGKAQVLVRDAPSFAIYGQHYLGEPTPYPGPNKLLTDPTEIGKYHIVFIPCSGGTNLGGEDPNAPKCTGVFNTDMKVKTTLNDFVVKGGRVYSSDWSYEYVRQVFPGFINWRGQSTQIGSACMGGGGTQSVTKAEGGLDAWLGAQMQSLNVVKDAWTAISSVQMMSSVDPDGKPVKVAPKVWVEADSAPVTTSLQHGCGRVLYTTYHTQPTSTTNEPLEPQALALLYLILEVGVCIDPVVIG